MKLLHGTSRHGITWSCGLAIHAGVTFPGDRTAVRKPGLHLPLFSPVFLKWPEMFSWFLRVAQTEVLPSGLWGHPRPSCYTHGCVVLGQGLGRCFSSCFPVRTLWSALLHDLLSAWRSVPVCVLQEAAGCTFTVSVHLVFPWRILFGAFKVLQKCSHLSVGFLWASSYHTPVILGETQGTRPSPEGLSQHVTGAPRPDSYCWKSHTKCCGNPESRKSDGLWSCGVYSFVWEPKLDHVKSLRMVSKPRVNKCGLI